MRSNVTSIVIPTYNHAQYLASAIDSALAQTAPVEVIVIDDASTDDTDAVLRTYQDRIFSFRLPTHSGPAAARNAGIEYSNGEFIMFLDADDVIARDKVARQAERMDESIGWILCDVFIEDVSGKKETASQRYDYQSKNLGGWIQDQLTFKNFIPIMSPLVRRSVLENIRFRSDRQPEDWHFWHEVSGAARCAYVPEVLATYRKRRAGRSSSLNRPRFKYHDTVVQPLRLNLGCGTPDTRSWHPIAGMMNLDRSLGWTFEDGLGDYVDGSVAGITISHALMYVHLDHWPNLFAEISRVLKPGGIVRITEDDTSTPGSSRIGGWQGSQPAVTLTDAKMARRHLEAAGFTVHDVAADATHFSDRSLIQAQHGAAPDCFWIEGERKGETVLFEPHADDSVLFSAFSIIRNKPRVVTVFPSASDYGSTDERHAETVAAVNVLGGGPVEQWDGKNIEFCMREFDKRIRPSKVWAPSPNASHPEHVAVADAAAKVFGDRLVRYHTYGDAGKVRTGVPVAFEQSWIPMKRKALACYATQLAHPRAKVFFSDDLVEYMEEI